MSPLFERGRFLSNGRLGISPQLPQCVSWLRFHVFPVPHCRCETIEVRCDLFLLSLFSCRILLTCRRVQETNRREEGKGHGEDNSKAQAEPPTKQHNTEEPQHERNQRKARPQKQTMSVSGVFSVTADQGILVLAHVAITWLLEHSELERVPCLPI